MTTYPATLAWTDAAAHGTWTERLLLAAGRLLTQAAADSARRRSERWSAGNSGCHDAAESQREIVRGDVVLFGLLRR